MPPTSETTPGELRCGSGKLGIGKRQSVLQPVANGGEQRMRNAQVHVLDQLHVVRRHNQAEITQVLHLAAGEPGQSNAEGIFSPSQSQGFQHIGRISARADGEHQVTGLNQVAQLFGEDVFVAGIVGPRGHHGNAVGERDDAKAAALMNPLRGALPQVASKVRGQGRTSAIPEDKYSAAFLVSTEEHIANPVHLLVGQALKYLGQTTEVLSGICDLG